MATSIAVKRLEDITECAICAGDLTDARVLPCVHTFCLKCIEKWSQSSKPGEKLSCPMCREECEISEGGVAALPQNYFVEKLLQVKKLSTTLAQGEITCDVCCDDKGKSGEKVTRKATAYCVECRRNMCEQCCGYHQKLRLPGVHKLLEISSEMGEDELLMMFPENICDKHSDKCLEIYCFDCKMAVCTMCYIKSHNSHKYSDIKEVAEDFSQQMSANAESLSTKVTDCKTVLKNIEVNEDEFCNSVAETEKLICERAEKLKQLIEDHKQSLLEELSVSKDRQLKQTRNVREEIERHQIVLENFIRYSDELKKKGIACDIAKLANELNARAKELQKFDVYECIDYNVTEVNFSSPQADDDLKLLFGNKKINIRGYFKVSGEVVHIIPSQSAAVTGIAKLNDTLYVNRLGVHQTAVYCPTTFQQQRVLEFTGGRHDVGIYGRTNIDWQRETQLLDMAACDVSNCLYASDKYTTSIYRSDCQNSYTNSRWSIVGNPQGLSVTSSHNLLVALQRPQSLQEYSTDGVLIREINLQPAGISHPVHAVELSPDHFAVTHHGRKHQLSIVDSNGKLVQSYGGEKGNLNNPHGIAVDKRGRVLVADQRNNRILVIGPKTLKAYPLLLPDCELNGPYCLHYEAATDRLYIGEWNGERIVCCKLGSIAFAPSS